MGADTWTALTGAMGDDHGDKPRFRNECKEGIPHSSRRCHNDSALPQVGQEQTWAHDDPPRKADGAAAEMAHVGIQGFTASQTQDDTAEHHKGSQRSTRDELDSPQRRECLQHFRRCDDGPGAERANQNEPEQHHRAHQPADPSAAKPLYEEDANHNEGRCHHHPVRLLADMGCCHAAHRAEHANRRRNDAIAVPKPARQRGRPPHRCRLSSQA